MPLSVLADLRRLDEQVRNETYDVARLDEQVRNEEFRLHTFDDAWRYSDIVNPAVLAREGFFYTGVGDYVQCAFCKGLLWCWKPEQKVSDLHAKYFSSCRFVQGHEVGNRPNPFLPLHLGDSTVTSRMLRTGGGQGGTQATPKYPDFSIEKSRLLTFVTWPKAVPIATADLAKAGFFYTGNGDSVTCFFCGGTADNWRNLGDPSIEHATRFPSCQFLGQFEGQSSTAENAGRTLSLNTAAPKKRFEHDQSEINMRMDVRKVRIVLNMGYPEDLIKQVVQNRLATNGTDHETSEDLLADAFKYHDERLMSQHSHDERRGTSL